MILQAQPPSAVRSSLAFIIQDYLSTDELTRSDKITAQGSIPAGKTKVALESFSHSLEHINVQLLEVFQRHRETGSSINAVCTCLMEVCLNHLHGLLEAQSECVYETAPAQTLCDCIGN